MWLGGAGSRRLPRQVGFPTSASNMENSLSPCPCTDNWYRLRLRSTPGVLHLLQSHALPASCRQGCATPSILKPQSSTVQPFPAAIAELCFAFPQPIGPTATSCLRPAAKAASHTCDDRSPREVPGEGGSHTPRSTWPRKAQTPHYCALLLY